MGFGLIIVAGVTAVTTVTSKLSMAAVAMKGDDLARQPNGPRMTRDAVAFFDRLRRTRRKSALALPQDDCEKNENRHENQTACTVSRQMVEFRHRLVALEDCLPLLEKCRDTLDKVR